MRQCCSFVGWCAFKNEPNKKGKGKGRPRSPSPTGSLTRNSKGDGKGSDDGVGLAHQLIKNGRNIDCNSDNDIPLVVPGMQAVDHQTRALGDRKQTRAVGDRDLQVETDLPDWLF